MQHFADIAFTDAVQQRQTTDGSREHYAAAATHAPPAALGQYEQEFLTAADSLYLATVNNDGWPYIQHRGGPSGFVGLIDDTTIAWLERSGNRQFVTAGNLDVNDKVSIFVMDYPRRTRLKLLGRAKRIDNPDAALVERLGGGRANAAVVVTIEAFDWNCPKFITPRYTEEMVQAAIEPLQQRIAELEAQRSP